MPIDTWSIEVFRVQNGFLTKEPTVLDDGTETEHVHVFEDDGVDGCIEEAMVDVMYHCLEHFGLAPGKHSRRVISIEIVEPEEEDG